MMDLFIRNMLSNEQKDQKDQKDNKNNNQKKDEKNQKVIPKENKDNKDNKLDKKLKKKEYKIFYSPYGYIKIERGEIEKNEPLAKFSQFHPAPFNPENCFYGTICKTNLMKEINIKIKTFYNQRAFYTIEKIDILSTLQLAVQRMFEQEKKEKEKKAKENNQSNEKKEEIEYEEERITEQSQYRIFSCHKQIHELNPTRNIFENEIQNDEILLYLPIKKLSFSEFMKDYSIKLSQENSIASKTSTDDPKYVLGNVGYSFGKHYFEVNLLTEPIAESVSIGIASKKIPTDTFTCDVRNFYGYLLSDMKKISYINGKTDKKEYSKEPIAINDIIGVLFEHKKEGWEISFYKNKICLGVAFNRLYNESIFYPAVRLGLIESKVQISNQIDFP